MEMKEKTWGTQTSIDIPYRHPANGSWCTEWRSLQDTKKGGGNIVKKQVFDWQVTDVYIPSQFSVKSIVQLRPDQVDDVLY